MNSRQKRKRSHARRRAFKHTIKASRKFTRAVGAFYDSIQAFQDKAVAAAIEDAKKDGRAR
jgi:hypothetical protein